jgi:hypothetical protein
LTQSDLVHVEHVLELTLTVQNIDGSEMEWTIEAPIEVITGSGDDQGPLIVKPVIVDGIAKAAEPVSSPKFISPSSADTLRHRTPNQVDTFE